MEVGSKAWWRRELRRRDRAVGPAASSTIRTAIGRFLDGRSGIVLAYRSLPGEVDLDPLIEAAIDRFALTRTPEDGDLTLHPAGSPTERHRFGFDQPVAGSDVVADREVAVVLVPGLAFDRSGARLGRGRGYYDRLLTRFVPTTALVGVTTEAAIVESVPVESHDIAMTHLVTEAGVVELRPTRP